MSIQNEATSGLKMNSGYPVSPVERHRTGSRRPRAPFRAGLLVNLVALLTLLVAVTALAVGSVTAQVMGRQIEQAADRRLSDGLAFFQASIDERMADLVAVGGWLSVDAQSTEAALRRDVSGLQPSISAALQLMAVDEILVADDQGTVLARGPNDDGYEETTIARGRGFFAALGGQIASGVVPAGDGTLLLQAYLPLQAYAQTEPIAVLRIASVVDQSYLQRFRSHTGLDASLFVGHDRVLSTLRSPDGEPLTQVKADPQIANEVMAFGTPVLASREFPTGHFRTYSAPLTSPDGEAVGMVSVALPTTLIQNELQASLLSLAPIVGLIVVAGLAAAYAVARGVSNPVLQLASAASRLRNGDLSTPIPVVRSTELEPLALELEQARLNLGTNVQIIASEEARQRALLAALREPILTATTDGRVTGFNQSARLFFGLSPAIDGRHIQELIPFAGPSRVWMEQESWQGELVDVMGHTRDLEVSRTRLAEGNLPTTDVYVVHDVSQYAEMNRLREELLYNVAHELRGPMAVLENAVDIIATDYGELSAAEFDRLTRSIFRTTRRLRNLLEDLLNAGSIQSGRFQVNTSQVELSPIVQDAIEAITPQLEARGQCVQAQTPPDCPMVLADRRYVRQVLTNLLSNAAKYSPDQATIDVRAEAVDGLLRVTVQDHGPGIPAAQQAGLFERFYRVRPGNAEPGIGLGLAIAKGIIDAHGGTMGVESSPGEGTSVWFTLPTGEQEP